MWYLSVKQSAAGTLLLSIQTSQMYSQSLFHGGECFILPSNDWTTLLLAM